jgi:hypothetical protein
MWPGEKMTFVNNFAIVGQEHHFKMEWNRINQNAFDLE